MGEYRSNHFVPQFLLKKWHSPPEGKLTYFAWKHARLVHTKRKAGSVACQDHLYATTGTLGSPDVETEQQFMTPEVDGPAALVHAKLLNRATSSPSLDEVRVWKLFLSSLTLRHPVSIEGARVDVAQLMDDHPDLIPPADEEIFGSNWEVKGQLYLQRRSPDMKRDAALKLLPAAIESSELMSGVLRKIWGVREIDQSAPDLLIGDRPLLHIPLDNDHCFLALPLSPRALYVTMIDEDAEAAMAGLEDLELVERANTATVKQAWAQVYSTGPHHEALVRVFLRRQTDGLAHFEEASLLRTSE